MRKFEYMVVEYEGQIPDEAELNRLGNEGWELLAFGQPKTPKSHTFELPSVMVFKREKEGAPELVVAMTPEQKIAEEAREILNRMGLSFEHAASWYQRVFGCGITQGPVGFVGWLKDQAAKGNRP